MGNICCCCKDNIEELLIRNKINKSFNQAERNTSPSSVNLVEDAVPIYVNVSETVLENDSIPNDIYSISKTISEHSRRISNPSANIRGIKEINEEAFIKQTLEGKATTSEIENGIYNIFNSIFNAESDDPSHNIYQNAKSVSNESKLNQNKSTKDTSLDSTSFQREMKHHKIHRNTTLDSRDVSRDNIDQNSKSVSTESKLFENKSTKGTSMDLTGFQKQMKQQNIHKNATVNSRDVSRDNIDQNSKSVSTESKLFENKSTKGTPMDLTGFQQQMKQQNIHKNTTVNSRDVSRDNIDQNSKSVSTESKLFENKSTKDTSLDSTSFQREMKHHKIHRNTTVDSRDVSRDNIDKNSKSVSTESKLLENKSTKETSLDSTSFQREMKYHKIGKNTTVDNRDINFDKNVESSTKDAFLDIIGFMTNAQQEMMKFDDTTINNNNDYIIGKPTTDNDADVYHSGNLCKVFKSLLDPSRDLNKRGGNKIFELEVLDHNSWEFIELKRKFMRTSKRHFKIRSIEKIYNPYLILQYALKKAEYIQKEISFKEELMFHGTKKKNIECICQENFNWRLNGAVRGYKFGQGVNFSPTSIYSTHYGDTTSYNKVMIAVNVLIGNSCIGSQRTIVPPAGYDTTTNEKGTVVVKYDDNTFYPSYLIHYCGFQPPKHN